MGNIFTLYKVEFKKLKHQYFFSIWILLTLACLIWILYPASRQAGSTRFIVDNPVLYQFHSIDQAIIILSLILPIMAGVLISKLIEMEHKGEGFKLLRTNNQSIKRISNIKFSIVFFLMELTTLLAIFSSVIQTYLIKGIPVPIAETIVSILIISLVNFINLTILTILAFYFKNQIIVMITSLLISMINIMSTLFPPIVVRFLPFSYYTFCLLSRFVRIGTDQEGLAIWSIENIKPEYHLIILVFTIFFIIFLVFRNSIEKREF